MPIARSAILVLAVAALGCGAAADAGERSRRGQPADEGEAAPAAWGPGYVVWESNRSGAFRILRRELAGGAARQISPVTKAKKLRSSGG